MSVEFRLQSAAAFSSAFRVPPEVVEEAVPAATQATGMSAHQAINLRRIEVARKLLAETDLDLAYVAQETGWCSQSHFTASFSKVVGCTPARFRALR